MKVRNLSARIDPRLNGKPFILNVASCEYKKGLDTLLHAVKVVRDSHRIDTNLAIVGPDRGIQRELQALAEQLGMSDNVFFCGEVPHADLHAYYSEASVFCLPSRAEPFGISLLEAGAFRRAVVATAVGGIPEILTHGINGCLVPPGEPGALAAQLARLLSDKEESSRLGEALFEHVSAHLAWKNAFRSYAALLAKMESGSQRSLNLENPRWT